MNNFCDAFVSQQNLSKHQKTSLFRGTRVLRLYSPQEHVSITHKKERVEKTVNQTWSWRQECQACVSAIEAKVMNDTTRNVTMGIHVLNYFLVIMKVARFLVQVVAMVIPHQKRTALALAKAVRQVIPRVFDDESRFRAR